jgi:hypothetical protein
MGLSARQFAALSAALSAAASGGAAGHTSSTVVYPVGAQRLAPLELSDLIARALPPSRNAKLSWSHMLSEPIVWRTDGFRKNVVDRSVTERVGLARVRLRGSWIRRLGGQREELAWTVRLFTRGDPRQGPREIEIAPGAPAGGCGGLGSPCRFSPADALRAPLTASEVCAFRRGGSRSAVHRVAAPGKAETLAAFTSYEGRTRVVLKPFASQAEACAQARALIGA